MAAEMFLPLMPSILHELPRAEEVELHHAGDHQLDKNENQVIDVLQHGQRFQHRIAGGPRFGGQLKDADYDREDRQNGSKIETVVSVAAGLRS